MGVTKQSSNAYTTQSIKSNTVWKVYGASTGDTPHFTYSTGSDIVFNIGSTSSPALSKVEIVESSQKLWKVPQDNPEPPNQTESQPEAEMSGLEENLAWLKLAESAFDFWDNEEDSIYDDL